ncbi:MAG TPA: NAD-dependent epimerase/dehydratase family protein [Thermoanaerobaculales bacterium]|nr:NAD-dependent epimerase/dehydratase family protein [Thermoanaerobaculales bacterium]HPA80005.1 NAD-dependent epimerase/dehydratase family protein [Thermoanaerobaculales bacterium]HQL30322.1 NAD-dependent epimerase/dehydratase family protein [Thermoanaerobaculales bacterium]HQN95295.1 NAD-dependent epimerase/dehydratase family protein [Thermoanaerobaculales bacterium]HQP42326.1 NAD-dependent epimerase/dehydratase family protein [Thermoanaerobaculales bacterium]
MATTRRDFIELTLLAGAAGVALTSRPAAAGTEVGRAARPLKILVLGGTGLIGPPMVSYAVARGHQVTLFNRGKTNTELFPSLERIIGDRNDDISALAAEVAKGRRWDVVIDNTASIPRWVEASAGLLAGSADLYLYTSSMSAYADTSVPGADETAPLGKISTEEAAAVKTNKDITDTNFGPLKALCERAAQTAFPGRSIVVRPGLIVGPGDYSDRFTYWPVRIHRGGEVLAPGDPTDPVQFIDCRDLGEWYVRLVEAGAVGVYNGVGPASPMSVAEMLYGIRATTGGEVSFTWLDAGFLKQHEVAEWAELTVWVPPAGENAGFATASIAAAKAAGLTFRPLATTAVDTLAYWSALPEERRAKPRAGLDPEKERAVLAAWHAKSAG